MEWAAAQARAIGYSADAEWLSGIYPWAGLGWVEEICGSCWDCCPRAYQRFSPPESRIVAAEAIESVIDAERGLPHVLPLDTLSLRGRRLYRIILDGLPKVREAISKKQKPRGRK